MTEKIDIDDLLAAAQRAPREASAELLGRVLQDAYELQPLPDVSSAAPERPSRRIARWFHAFGGAAGIAGLGAAAIGGVWIGFADPQDLSLLAEDYLSGSALDTVDLYPEFDALLSEG